jgi:hypothetical protein
MIIDKKLPGRMVMARPWVRHVLRREYERIHPDLSVRYATSELPYWGLPEVPILAIQAGQDEMLGEAHFALFKEHLGDVAEVHVLNDMPHTSRVDLPVRRAKVEAWLEAMR